MAKKRFNQKLSDFFTITWKKTAIALMIWIAAVFFHNMVYAFFVGVLGIEFEEPVLFLIAVVVIPLYFLISIIYSLIKKK